MSQPRVWAIVLNHRQAAQTLRAVEAVEKVKYRSGHLTVCVVDNGSGEEDVAQLRAGTPLVLESGGNLGYAGGNNVGIRAALEDGADAIWILNPDAEPMPRSLQWMVRVLGKHEKAGIVGCRILEGKADFPTIQSQGGRIDWAAGGRSILMRRGERANHLMRGGVQEVNFAPGASFVVRREVLEEIGLLPERYFMYFEETEFCVDAVKAGWKVMVTPWADVVHTSDRVGSLPGEIYT
ncbi:glycosyltransferase family 2 protein, partial [bacterium]|nr:glycosyltransferase family 2 protein [bacterium]